MQFSIEATVTYTFTPDEETIALIREKAQECKSTLTDALWDLYFGEGKVNPYDDSCGTCVESDFCTETIDYDGHQSENDEFWDC